MLGSRLFKHSKLVFVSPWLLAAAIGLLTLIIVALAAKNIQREKDLMAETLFQKGRAVIRFVGAGMRSSRLAGGVGLKGSESEAAHMQFLIEQTSDDSEIVYITVIDNQGKIMAHSDSSLVGVDFDRGMEYLKKKGSRIGYTIVTQPGTSKKIFEVVGRFEPNQQRDRHFLRRHMREMLLMPGAEITSSAESGFILVGFDMTDLENAGRQYRYQIIFLSLVLLLVGLGGWISLLALQGYRISEQTLNRVQAFTGMLISRLPVGIIATDVHGRIKTFNQAAVELVGEKSEEVVNQRPEDVLPVALARFFRLALQEPDSTAVTEQELVLVREGHPDRSLLVSAVPVYNKQKVYMGIVLLLHDLSELKKLEKQVRRQDRLVALGKMAAGVAHEVRNPLSSIKGFATLLGSKFSQGSKEQEIAELLVSEAERLNRSITELLNFTRPVPLKKIKMDIRDFFGKSLQLIETDAQTLGVSLSLDIAPGITDIVVDPDRMNQVMLNLYLNALQAMESKGGGGELAVRVRPNDQIGGIDITVADNGEGVSEDLLEHLLDPYFTTKPEGTGLGLAIANKIIDEHLGTISFVSRQGKGTTVTISLPFQE
jgi:two-component system sensor histidine kinase HydH